MRMLRTALGLMLTAGTGYGDMGYFGTIAQNPVPLDTLESHRQIELSCEDVLIEILPGGEARITADFLFTNTGPAASVQMYFPLSVMVPTISVLWSLDEVSDPLEEPVVLVDGESVPVHPLLATRWNRRYEEEGSWEMLLGMFDVLTPSEPDSGLVFYLADPDYWGGLDMMETALSDSLSEQDLRVLRTYSSHALWTVPFQAGEEVLVSYITDFHMRYEWEQPSFHLSYPLYTGASWAGPIGSGRITVTTADGRDFSDITGWTSTSIPEPQIRTDYILEALPGMRRCSGLPAAGRVSSDPVRLDTALVWEFNDFEPVVSPQGWMYYFEDSESENARMQADLTYWPEKPPMWPSCIRISVRNRDFDPDEL